MTASEPSAGDNKQLPLASPDEMRGILAALGAFVLWGLAPIYFKWLSHISPLEVISHRIVWSVIFVLTLVVLTRKTAQFVAIFRDRRRLVVFMATTVIIGGNWLTFIWAIANDRILEASLGYYINPLVNIMLGMIFLKERLNKWQTVSVLLAVVAVAMLTIQAGYLPWVSLILAFSFGFYALLRKQTQVDSAVGLAVETSLLFPLALGFLLYASFTPVEAPPAAGVMTVGFDHELTSLLLLIATGVVTAMPLMLYATATRYLKLTT
ncbi:MAG: protein RarD, partial [Sneathiella sp.]